MYWLALLLLHMIAPCRIPGSYAQLSLVFLFVHSVRTLEAHSVRGLQAACTGCGPDLRVPLVVIGATVLMCCFGVYFYWSCWRLDGFWNETCFDWHFSQVKRPAPTRREQTGQNLKEETQTQNEQQGSTQPLKTEKVDIEDFTTVSRKNMGRKNCRKPKRVRSVGSNSSTGSTGTDASTMSSDLERQISTQPSENPLADSDRQPSKTSQHSVSSTRVELGTTHVSVARHSENISSGNEWQINQHSHEPDGEIQQARVTVPGEIRDHSQDVGGRNRNLP